MLNTEERAKRRLLELDANGEKGLHVTKAIEVCNAQGSVDDLKSISQMHARERAKLTRDDW